MSGGQRVRRRHLRADLPSEPHGMQRVVQRRDLQSSELRRLRQRVRGRPAVLDGQLLVHDGAAADPLLGLVHRCLDDPSNCGQCGIACSQGAACVAGVCQLQCGANHSICGGACIDETSDPNNCGSCGNSCGSSVPCVGGVCSCAGNQSDCAGFCVDETSDNSNCGGCDTVCGAGTTCQGGTCQCANGGARCNGNCVLTQSDANNCGWCGNVCPAGEVCSQGTAR